MNKKLIAAASIALAACVAIGGTIAYLTDKTETITNTFTVGNVDITLTEEGAKDNAQDFHVYPGEVKDKIAYVEVEEGSENCFVYVKAEAENMENIISWDMSDDWTLVTGEDDVWYYNKPVTVGTPLHLLDGDHVTVGENVTEFEQVPTLKFTAYAVQSDGFNGDASVAWTATFGGSQA